MSCQGIYLLQAWIYAQPQSLWGAAVPMCPSPHPTIPPEIHLLMVALLTATVPGEENLLKHSLTQVCSPSRVVPVLLWAYPW